MRRRRGNVALGAALMIMPLSLLAGLAIDFGRLYVAQSRLSQAVDAGALAGARVLGVSDPAPDARMYFQSNLRMRDDQLRVDNFTVTPARDNRTLDVAATGRLNTTFLKLAGERWHTLPVAARATARRTTMGMELALVLDTTGSMGDAAGGGQSKMVAARSAALDLVAILFGAKTEADSLYISVVPYVTSINIGTNNAGWLAANSIVVDPATGERMRRYPSGSQLRYQQFTWRGCVEARAGSEDLNDAPPAAVPFQPYFWPRDVNDSWKNFWGTADPAPAIARSTKDDYDGIDPVRMRTPTDSSLGPNVACPQPIAGLTNNRASIERILRAVDLSRQGGTQGINGLQGGWMTLSPRWRGLWGTSMWGTTTPSGLPLDYPGPRSFMTKVIVMMTDGDNNIPGYGGYGRLTEARLGSTSAGTAETNLNRRQGQLCTRIKDTGIKIYTITFGTSIDSATQTIYRNCSSGSGYYFHAPSGASLRSAFQEIGTQLSNLRLEK